MAFEKRKFVVESGCCAATKGKTVYDRVLEQARAGLEPRGNRRCCDLNGIAAKAFLCWTPGTWSVYSPVKYVYVQEAGQARELLTEIGMRTCAEGGADMSVGRLANRLEGSERGK